MTPVKNLRPWPDGLALGLLFFFYLGLSFWTLRLFPPVNGDELSNTVYGYNLLHGQGHRNHLMDDVFEPSLASIRDAGFELTRVIYNPLVGMWTLMAGRSYEAVRLFSSVLNVITLIFFFLIVNRLANRQAAWIAVCIAALHPIFWMVGILIRPESLLLCATTGLFWLDLKLRPSWDLKPILIGFLTGACVGIHQNILIFFAGLVIFHLGFQPSSRRLRDAILLVGFFLAGALFISLWVDLRKLLYTPLAFHLQFYRAPITTWPWHPWEWITSTFSTLYRGQTYYFSADAGGLWVSSFRMACCVMGVGLLGWLPGLKTASPQERRLPAVLFGATLVGLLFLIFVFNRKDTIYFIILLPFIIPLSAIGLWRIRVRSVAAFSGLMALALSSCVLFLCFAKGYGVRAMPQAEIVSRLDGLAKDPEARRIGPAVLWFGVPSDRFRDIGAITYSYLFTGRLAMPLWLDPWKPEILITDEPWSRMFLKDRPRADRLSILMGNRRVEYLGTVDTGLAMGLLDVYRIHWRKISD